MGDRIILLTFFNVGCLDEHLGLIGVRSGKELYRIRDK